MMKKQLLFLTLLLFSALHDARAQTPPPAAAQKPAPAAAVTVGALKFMPVEVAGREMRDVEGRSFRLSDFGGRVYVLNLWATWCGPCHAEIPGLNKVYEEYSARGVEFIGLTTEDPEHDGEKVRQFARELRMKYRLGWLDLETARVVTSLGPAGRSRFSIPQTFVVAADGRIVLHIRGYNPRVPEMVRAGVKQALALSATAPPDLPAAPASSSPAPPSGTPDAGGRP